MDTRAYFRERLPQVEAALEAALPPADTPPLFMLNGNSDELAIKGWTY